MSSNLETRYLLDEWRNFDKGGFFDFGHPLFNRIAECFVKAGGIGAIQAVARDACLIAVGRHELNQVIRLISLVQRRRSTHFPDLRGETNRKSLEAMVKNTGKESLQWGLAAGLYSGLTYGLKEAREAHDWKNSAVAGAITGMVVAFM